MAGQGTIFSEIKLLQVEFDQGISSVDKKMKALVAKLVDYESKIKGVESAVKSAGSALNNMPMGAPGRVAALEKEVIALEKLKAVGSPSFIGQQEHLAKVTAALKLEQAELTRSAKLQQYWAQTMAQSAAPMAKVSAEAKAVAADYFKVGNEAQIAAGKILQASRSSASMFRPAGPQAGDAKSFMSSSGYTFADTAALKSMETHLDKVGTTGKRAMTEIHAGSKQAAAGVDGLNMSFSSLTPVIVTNYLAYLALQKTINAITNEITKGITSVSDYNVAVATATGFITTFSEQANSGDIAGAFENAHRYASLLVPKLEEMDAKTIATGQDLNLVYQGLVKNGVQLDVSNEKQVDGFLAITNTLKLLFPLQKDQIQIQQEINGLMDGEFKSSDKLAKLLVARDPLLKEHLKTWREEGRVIEEIAKLVPGMNAAVGLLADDWSVVGSTLETIHVKILREGFKPAVADIITLSKELRDTLMDADGRLTERAYEIQSAIRKAYEATTDISEAALAMGGAWLAAKVATMAWAGAVGIGVAEVTALDAAIVAGTYSQLSFNAAAAANPWILLGTAAVGSFILMKEHLERLTEEMLASQEVMLPPEGLTYEMAMHQAAIDDIVAKITELRESGDPWAIFESTEDVTRQIKALEEELNKLLTLSSLPVLDDPRILNVVGQKTKAPKLSIPAGEDEKAVSAAKKAADDYAKSVDTLLDKLLPLEAESKKYAADQALINKLHAEGKLVGDRYGQAIKALEENTSAYKDEVKLVAEGIKDAVAELEEWKSTQKELNDLMVSTLPEQEQAIEKVRLKYIETTDAIRRLDEAGRLDADAYQMRIAGANRERDAALASLRDTEKGHKETSDEVSKLWEHTYERMQDFTADWLAGDKKNLDKFGEYFRRMVSQMVASWIFGQMQMKSVQEQNALASSAGTMGTMVGPATTADPKLGLLTAGVSLYNEYRNPGSYQTSLNASQSNWANGLQGVGLGTVSSASTGSFGAGSYGAGSFMATNYSPVGTGTVLAPNAGTGAAGTVGNMSSAAYGGWSAGIGSFVVSLLQGKDFKSAAIQGAATGAGAYAGGAAGGAMAGAKMGSYWPVVGTIIGAVLGSLLGSAFGGKQGGPDRYHPNLLNNLTDNTWSEYGGFSPVKKDPYTGDHYSYPAANAGLKAYVKGVGQIQDYFDKEVEGMKDKMSNEVWKTFTKALSKIEFKDPTPEGKIKVSNVAEATERYLTDYGEMLDAGLNKALKAALPILAKEMILDNENFKYLDKGLQDHIRKLTKSKNFTPEDLGIAAQYMDSIAAAFAPITEALEVKDLTQYGLQLRTLTQQFDAYEDNLESAGVSLKKYTGLQKVEALALKQLTDEARKPVEEAIAAHSGTETSRAIKEINDWYKDQIEITRDLKSSMSIKDYRSWIADLKNAKFYQISDIAFDARTPAKDIVSAHTGTETSRAIKEINDWYKDQIKITKDLKSSMSTKDYRSWIADLKNAQFFQIGDIVKEARDYSREIIAAHSGTELTRGLKEINQWYKDQVEVANDLKSSMTPLAYKSWMSDLSSAAEYQTKDLIDQWITPVTKSWKDFFDSITLSDMAPSQSVEAYQRQYKTLRNAATDGKGDAAADSQAFQSFITGEYLPFMKAYSPGNYQQLFDQTITELRGLDIKIGTVSATQIGTSIADALLKAAPGSTNKDGKVTVVINLDSREISSAVVNTIVTAPDLLNPLLPRRM